MSTDVMSLKLQATCQWDHAGVRSGFFRVRRSVRAFAVFAHLAGAPSPEEVTAELNKTGSMVSVHGADRGPSPVGVVGTDTIHVGRIRRDSRDAGAYSLWIVADNLRVAASNAIQTAEQIMFAPALGA